MGWMKLIEQRLAGYMKRWDRLFGFLIILIPPIRMRSRKKERKKERKKTEEVEVAKSKWVD